MDGHRGPRSEQNPAYRSTRCHPLRHQGYEASSVKAVHISCTKKRSPAPTGEQGEAESRDVARFVRDAGPCHGGRGCNRDPARRMSGRWRLLDRHTTAASPRSIHDRVADDHDGAAGHEPGPTDCAHERRRGSEPSSCAWSGRCGPTVPTRRRDSRSDGHSNWHTARSRLTPNGLTPCSPPSLPTSRRSCTRTATRRSTSRVRAWGPCRRSSRTGRSVRRCRRRPFWGSTGRPRRSRAFLGRTSRRSTSWRRGMGRIHGNSSAGAQGPMQFIPSTWAAYGNGGDVNDDHDAILAAGRFLAASGGATDIGRALFRVQPQRRLRRRDRGVRGRHRGRPPCVRRLLRVAGVRHDDRGNPPAPGRVDSPVAVEFGPMGVDGVTCSSRLGR